VYVVVVDVEVAAKDGIELSTISNIVGCVT
jgi:hypothetical protein